MPKIKPTRILQIFPFIRIQSGNCWLFTNNGYLNNKNIELLVAKYGYDTDHERSIENSDDSIKKIFHEVSNFIKLEKVAQWLDRQVSLKADDDLKLNSQQKKIIKKILLVIVMGEKSKRTIDLNQYGWDPLFNQINMTHAIIDDDFYGAKWVKGKRVGRQYHTTIYNGWLHQNTEDKKNHEIAYVYKRFLATSNTVIFHKGLFTDLNLKSKKYPKAAKHFNSVLKNATPLDTNQAKAFYLLLKDYLLETFQNEKSPLRKALKESGYSNIIYSSENNSLLGFNSKGKGDNMVGELLSHIRDGTIDNNKENSTQTLDELLKVYSDSLTNPEKNNYLCIPSDIEIRADNFPGGKVNYY